jgi:hypothetical protein
VASTNQWEKARPHPIERNRQQAALWKSVRADLCEGVLYVIDSATAKPEATSLGLSVQEPTSFGMDAEHRIYLTTAKGEVYRLDPK